MSNESRGLSATTEMGTTATGLVAAARDTSQRGWQRLITPRLWLIVALAAVIGLYAAHTLSASLVIDGERWFWLDDDEMVSMRYARNFVERQGLVWNPGERVEGYTNLGWVLIMAAVHLLPLPDRLMPLAMTVVSGLVCLAVIALTARLLERMDSRRLALTLPATLFCVLTCADIMFWAVSGFETVLVAALHLTVVICAVSGRLDAKLLVALALIPIVRSDGMHIWLGDALLVLWLASDRKRAGLFVLLSLLPFATHLLFRLAYYRELLPNTYYLKVAGLDARWSRGFDYVLGFSKRYSIVLILAVGTVASLWRRDVRTRSLLTSLAPPFFYSLSVGGDDFYPFRFFSHVMPELFVWASLGAANLVTAMPARVAWLAALVAFSLPTFKNPIAQIAGVGNNGDPFDQIVVAAELLKNASPHASVAVVAAGIVPYYTRLTAVDLLGKTDVHIAHLPPQQGAQIGHGKIDPPYSFGKRPDYVVSYRPIGFAQAPPAAPSEVSPDYVLNLLSSREFRKGWAQNPVPDPFLLERSAVYVWDDSPELTKLSAWRGVAIGK